MKRLVKIVILDIRAKVVITAQVPNSAFERQLIFESSTEKILVAPPVKCLERHGAASFKPLFKFDERCPVGSANLMCKKLQETAAVVIILKPPNPAVYLVRVLVVPSCQANVKTTVERLEEV
jgi:hypothetical protein